MLGSLGIHDLPGGFGPYLLAPVNAVLPVPEAIGPECAVLVEPSWSDVENDQLGHRVARLGSAFGHAIGQMIALAGRRDLFPRSEFPLPPGKGEQFTKLSVDPDGRTRV